jgi:sodium transport system permease protein
MRKNNNILTIFRKECARFFGDRTLVFTAIIMPGLLIYLVYSLIGSGIAKEMQEKIDKAASADKTVMMVENMPSQLAPMIDSLVYFKSGVFDTAEVFAQMRDKENNTIYVVFPENLAVDGRLTPVTPDAPVPHIQIYYNSANLAALQTYSTLVTVLNGWEESVANVFDINADPATQYDVVRADEEREEELDDLLSKLVPMLILMMMFSACMAVAPTAIAGEKERGTIATLLVTPMRRNELAWGKILSITCFALLSGCSSFLGIMLSLPKMVHADDFAIDVNYYGFSDYVCLLVVILCTVLLMVAAVSLLSALAKDTKSAGTLTVPFMLVVMAVGMTPLLGDGVPDNLAYYLIPFYGNVQAMASVFARQVSVLPLVVTLLSNLCYTGLAVWVLTRMFNNEKIMFGR